MTHRVLITEDQPDIRKLIRMTLEFEDYELHEADNGADGLRLAQQLKPSIVLLDVMMPGELDGYQVCEKIKKDPTLGQKTKVVMLTARGQQSDLQQGQRAGCDAYLTKPFSPLELLELLEKLVAQVPA
ncbi:MAG: response regulator [Gammaproteobacteria bacterium]|jgi:CheY-like chemotaxis protein|nr:response regulator [Gammaproteobacteria bacterium]MBU0787763.1 response regulator [Gammaproteobacteria bacterium]MBU0816214.1 response regulator [Gammaproteobacteria bacterium]MBU1786125.1 response regulator [Gammaproteobacteria bacterium]